VHDAASAIIAPDADHLPAYRLFREAVARAQLAAWLPRGRQVLVDVSGPRAATAELAARAGHTVDLPHAEVVLVPWPDGTITRCYGPDQARELFIGAGLEVNWIRPRTALSESMVTHVLQGDPARLPRLVRAELAARSDESLGAQLVISARKG